MIALFKKITMIFTQKAPPTRKELLIESILEVSPKSDCVTKRYPHLLKKNILGMTRWDKIKITGLDSLTLAYIEKDLTTLSL